MDVDFNPLLDITIVVDEPVNSNVGVPVIHYTSYQYL